MGPANRVKVLVRGWLTDGTPLASAQNSGELVVALGDPWVLAGWREGLEGMQVGGTRRLILPSDLAYGPKGLAPQIPPHSTLIYDVKLLAIL